MLKELVYLWVWYGFVWWNESGDEVWKEMEECPGDGAAGGCWPSDWIGV